jgi:hypothetical protein
MATFEPRQPQKIHQDVAIFPGNPSHRKNTANQTLRN